MRLLVIGHTYLTAFNQSKYIEMKRQCSELQIKILTPRTIQHTFGLYHREVAKELTGDEVVDIGHFNFAKSHMTYVLAPFKLASILRAFRPDRVHIEEDPYSAVGVEAVTMIRLLCPDTKISFFVWDNLARTPQFPLNLIKWALDKYSLTKADLVVCGNAEGAALVREKRGFTGKTAVLPQLGLNPDNYLDPQRGQAKKKELRVPDGSVLIGYVGRLVLEKGLLHLLQALEQLKDLPWSLLILGSGPLEPEVIRAKEIFGERLIFQKAVPHSEVPLYIQALDLLVLPSFSTPAWKEQFGIVLAQAMLAGIPCIGSSSGAIPDVIGPGGIIFVEKDVADLRLKLKEMLSSEMLRKKLSSAAREYALKNYTHAAVALAYFRLFFGERNDR